MIDDPGTVSSLTPTPSGEEFLRGVESAIARAQNYFLREQKPEGYWYYPLEANATMDAEYIFFNHFMGRVDEQKHKRICEHLLAMQGDDGAWPLFYKGPGHLSNTIEAYFALKLTGYPASHPALRKARDFILAHGGVAHAQVFTRIFLAYFEQFPWRGTPAVPVELILLPNWFPLNIYEMSSWARGTVVPLSIILAHRPRVAILDERGVAELWKEDPERSDLRFPRSSGALSWENFFIVVNHALKLLEHSPMHPLRRRALRKAERWVLEHQDVNGGWGGIQPAMLNSVMALHSLGYPHDHPVIVKGIQAIEDFLMETGGHLLFQPCVSPVWDTVWAVKALIDSGLPHNHPVVVKAANWIIDQQIFKTGDWQVKNPHLEPGGWAFEFANDWYPDVDDSAVILFTLKMVQGLEERKKDRAIARGLNWTLGMQSRNGGWGAFDTDNTLDLWNQMPFGDMKAMIDPPTADLTGRLLEMMGAYGYDVEFGRARRALHFLRHTQEADGSWWGRWGVNYIYGTWSVLMGLRAIGEDLQQPYVRRAVAWLKDRQNADGGWGEDCLSYWDQKKAGKGESTPSQTAWAVLGLLAGEDEISPAVFRGIQYLLSQQEMGGAWPEELFTGTGFPRHFYLRYYGYRNYFPLMALGQFRCRLQSLVHVHNPE
ncbi:MAG TPA: squalene--hopene cyclase [Methylomirabilota bacterium]|nr:squalene--hopene cyclase [Methylomirabilota bacterium]